MKGLITSLILCCCLSIGLNLKLYADMKDIKETVNYLETALETIAAINISATSKNDNKIKLNNKPPLVFDNNEEMERRIQNLEYENRIQQSKLNDVEREAYQAQSTAYQQRIEHEKIQNKQTELIKKLNDKENFERLNGVNSDLITSY